MGQRYIACLLTGHMEQNHTDTFFMPMHSLNKYVFVCLFWIRKRICPTGSTPKGEHTEISPTTQATRHPRALSFFMFPVPPPPPPPPYICHASCIRSVPSPVFLSYTHILTQSLVCPILAFPSYTYI